jgi:hypothetical protein
MALVENDGSYGIYMEHLGRMHMAENSARSYDDNIGLQRIYI